MTNRIRAAWDAGRPAVTGWLNIASTLAAEAMARCGFDALVIDLQHGEADLATALPMLLAIEAGGAEAFARVPANNAASIMRLLDWGATGIIAPMVNDAADARAFAAALHYPPKGERSYGPRRPQHRFGPDYLANASASIVSLAMIETRAGLDNLDAILAVPGYDGVFIGPSDLALALGASPQSDNEDPGQIETIRNIIARCKAAEKRVGIYCTGPAFARTMIDMGCDIVSIAPDLGLLVDGARESLRRLGPLAPHPVR